MPISVLCFTLLILGSATAAGRDLVAHWSFDQASAVNVRESVSGTDDSLSGLHKYVKGVSGSALRFDGYTTVVTRKAANVAEPGEAFTIEAWLALEAYPWTWCAIVDDEYDQEAGYYFAVDPEGHFGLHLAVNNVWQTVTSESAIPLYRWNHLTGVYDPARGVSLYLNGKLVKTFEIQGKPTLATKTNLQIGRNIQPRALAHAMRQAPPSPFSRPLPMPISLDGILDEVSIYNGAMSAEEVGKQCSDKMPSGPDPLSRPVLPSGPRKPGRFGAYYTRLRYTDIWETPWRVDEHPDVVVRFDEAPYEFVFWRGTRVPCWVSENNIWYSNEFFETWDPDMKTGAEPLADKQARYSHVRIIESNEARVVLHWRYAPIQIDYEMAHMDSSGWADWVDEYYTIYPDGTCVRKMKVWTSSPHRIAGTGSLREFHEAIVINPPGTHPEDNIKLGALSLANLAGEVHDYSWVKGAPGTQVKLDPETLRWLDKEMPGASIWGRRWFTEPPNPSVHLVHLKAVFSPYVIIDPRRAMMAPYGTHGGETFPWWNHWPVAQILSFGRYAFTPDRASHSSLSHIYWPPIEETAAGMTKIMLNGMTDRPAADLVPLARSWLSPPKVEVRGDNFKSEGYDPMERAYRFTRKSPGALELTLLASDPSPVFNPVIVVKDWGQSAAKLKIDGKPAEVGKGVRIGMAHKLEGTDLVVWIRKQSASPVTVSLAP